MTQTHWTGSHNQHGGPGSMHTWPGLEVIAEMRERLATLEAHDRYFHNRLESLSRAYHDVAERQRRIIDLQDGLRRDLDEVRALGPVFRRMRRELDRRDRSRRLVMALLQYGAAGATIVGVATGAVSGEQAAAVFKALFGGG